LNVASVPETRCLGLVGGLGPAATIYYYRELVAAHEAQGRVPRLLISHADVNRALARVKDNDLPGLAQYLAQFIENMAAGGAELTAIVAITPHICAPQLVQISPLPLINMIEEVASVVRAKGLKRVAMLGTRFTIETRMFGQLGAVEIVTPKPNEIDAIHNAYMEIVNTQRGSPENIATLKKLAYTLIERDGAEAILLAGTDMSMVFDAGNTDFPAIDCARVHVDAIMRRLVA
jgi:aspartate racemase